MKHLPNPTETFQKQESYGRLWNETFAVKLSSFPSIHPSNQPWASSQQQQPANPGEEKKFHITFSQATFSNLPNFSIYSET